MKKTIILVVLSFLLLNVSGCSTSRPSTSETRMTPLIKVTADKILTEYIQDPKSADQKYDRKQVKIASKVFSKGFYKDFPEFYIIAGEKISNGKRYLLLLNYTMDNVDEINAKKIGDFIAAEGTFYGCTGYGDSDSDSDTVTIALYVHTKQ